MEKWPVPNDEEDEPEHDQSATPSKSVSQNPQAREVEAVPLEKKHSRKPRRPAQYDRKKHLSNHSNRMQEEDGNSKQTAKSRKITDYFAECPRISFSQEIAPTASDWDPIISRKQEEIDAKEDELAELRSKKTEMEETYSNHKLALDNDRRKVKEIISMTLSQLYVYKRKDRQRPNFQLGYLRNSMSEESFVEGPLLINLKDKLRKLEVVLGELRNCLAQEVSKEEQLQLEFRIGMLSKEHQQGVQQLSRLEKEKITLIHNLKLSALEANCRMARDNWPTLNDRYLTLELLGKGGFSEVYRCFDLKEQAHKAMKLSHIAASVSNRQTYMKHVVREYKTQKALSHRNIIKITDVIALNDECIASVLELCNGCDLATQIKQQSRLPEKEAKIIVRQILAALSYMDSLPSKIIHYDLKPQNILFQDGMVKLADFGLCKIVDSSETRIELTSQGSGTYWYLPPETFDNSPKISNKVDVWSVGIIFYQMLYGRRPFGHGMSQNKIFHEGIISSARKVDFAADPAISQLAQRFIVGCLQYNQETRLSVSEAYNHQYFSTPQ